MGKRDLVKVLSKPHHESRLSPAVRPRLFYTPRWRKQFGDRSQRYRTKNPLNHPIAYEFGDVDRRHHRPTFQERPRCLELPADFSLRFFAARTNTADRAEVDS